MKNYPGRFFKRYLTVITLFGAFALWTNPADAQAETNEYELAYQQFVKGIRNGASSSLFSFSEDDPYRAESIRKIKSYGLRMGEFMCEKVLSTPDTNTHQVYEDIKLLEAITGINIAATDVPFEYIFKHLATRKAHFREEWRAGVYEHPDKKVAELLEPLIKKEPVSTIYAPELVGIMRYGVYAVPELIRQIKKHNSANAFCAYMRIADIEEYSIYLRNPDKMYVTKDQKLEHIQGQVKRWKANGGDKLKVVMKIEAALKE